MILMMLDNVTQGELTRYEKNYKPLILITTVLGMNVYDRVIHLETAHDVCLKLCNTYEDSSESHLTRTLTIGSIRLFLKNLVNLLMIILLGLSLS
jgi:hypothetical protein